MSVEWRDGHAYCDALPGSCYVLEDKRAEIEHLRCTSDRFRAAATMALSYLRSERYDEAQAMLEAAFDLEKNS